MEDFKRFYTAESVTEGHPDKLCDKISDAILDAYLAKDKNARVACEVLATRGNIVVSGEVTCSEFVNIPNIIYEVLSDVGYDPRKFVIDLHLHRQSADIAAGVDTSLEVRRGVGSETDELGAGDQGVMVGFACDETKELMPLPVVLAHRLTNALTVARKSGLIYGLQPDGKAQVTVEYENDKPKRIEAIVISTQHDAEKSQEVLAFEISDKILPLALRDFPIDENTRILVNPSGRFVEGGPSADTGLTGRKLMVDTYGTFAPHGGGAFSGKDPTKVDRSGAYMARYIAKNIVAAGFAQKCMVTLAYAIGVSQPVMVEVETFGTGTVCADDCLAKALPIVFDLSPSGIISTLNLTNLIYQKTATGGHFGRSEFAWEQTDKIEALRGAIL